MPNGFRTTMQAEHGQTLFVTSIEGESVRLYPMPVWIELEKKLAKVPETHPARRRFLERVNFFGQVTEFDPQGRVLIPQRLRESAQMDGEVDVLGQDNYLEVWNHGRLLDRMKADPFTDRDARALAKYLRHDAA